MEQDEWKETAKGQEKRLDLVEQCKFILLIVNFSVNLNANILSFLIKITPSCPLTQSVHNPI